MTKISALAADNAPTLDDSVPTYDINTGSTKRSTLQKLRDLFGQNPSMPFRFRATRVAAQNTAAAAFVIIGFDTEDYDPNGNHDITTNKGRYTAPVAGDYFFSATWQASLNGTGSAGISLFLNGVRKSDGSYQSSTAFSNAVNNAFHVSDTLHLAAGDYVEVGAWCSAVVAIQITAGYNHFSGHLVST